MFENQVTLQDIPIHLLVAHPENSNLMDAETLKKLRRHIEQTGRYEPLTVRAHPWEEGNFQVINGHNRLRVLRALKHQTALCVVWNLDDAQTRLYLATLNRLSGNDIPERRAALLENLLDIFDIGELSTLLPDDRKQLEELNRLSHLELDEFSELLISPRSSAAARDDDIRCPTLQRPVAQALISCSCCLI